MVTRKAGGNHPYCSVLSLNPLIKVFNSFWRNINKLLVLGAFKTEIRGKKIMKNDKHDNQDQQDTFDRAFLGKPGFMLLILVLIVVGSLLYNYFK